MNKASVYRYNMEYGCYYDDSGFTLPPNEPLVEHAEFLALEARIRELEALLRRCRHRSGAKQPDLWNDIDAALCSAPSGRSTLNRGVERE